MLRTTLFAAVLTVGLVACGGEETPPTPQPVADTVMKGKIAGLDFEAKGAVARPDSFNEGKYRIEISSKVLACADFSFGDEPHILHSTEWTEGAAYDLSLQKNLTFVNKESDGTYMNDVATTGRVEIAKAPKTGTGRIRIRASTSDSSVEGAIDVVVCEK